MGILLAFGAGALAGVVGLAGLWGTFTPRLGLGAAGSLVLVIVAYVLATRRTPQPEPEPRLPGERYADREAPDPNEETEPPENGRVPIADGSGAAPRAEAEDPDADLRERLERVNKELQKANVKLGLGELSEEGYAKIVERLKKRRAKLEDQLNQHT